MSLKFQIELPSPVEISGSEMLGIYNMDTPGPIDQQYCEGTKLLTSLLDSTSATLPADLGADIVFDDLAFPYCIPLKFCEKKSECQNLTWFAII